MLRTGASIYLRAVTLPLVHYDQFLDLVIAVTDSVVSGRVHEFHALISR